MLLMEEIAGATGAGCASTLFGHPLDTIKVHLQTNPKLGGTWEATKYLLHSNSPLVFFRGIIPPLFNAVVMNTVMFSVFEGVKQSLGPMGAGFVSGIATACLSTPTDYIKIQSQLSGVSSMDLVKTTLKQHPTRLFRGHLANLGREGVFTMVYLGLYDVLRSNSNHNNNLIEVAATSSLTGGLAWVASYSFDTVKTVVQATPGRVSYREAVQQLWNQGGYKAFYKGCGTSTGRAVLVTSIRMITYEWILGLF